MMQRLRLSYVLFLCTFFFIQTSAEAQISQGGTPYSFNVNSLAAEVHSVEMPPFDLQPLLIEDSIDMLAGNVPYRSGKAHEVSLNLSNSGTWETLPNGDKIWRLKITSPGAYSINLLYDQFFLPQGAELFIYNSDQSDVLGAFTSINNNPDGTFSSFLTSGETTILEYYEPAAVSGQGVLSISSVVHGYRQMLGNNERGYGDAGFCNINVNCPEGEEWQDQKRSVGMVLLGNGTRWCSGALVNNTAQDGTPYFLTANHCRNGESNWIIVFNYESPGCENQNGPLNQTIQYTTLRAFNSASDFALIELSTPPPADYNVYYSGWSRINEPHDWSVGIHHPRGDIKKICFDDDPVTSSQWGSGPSNTHWRVGNWEEGTTEPASSGSPLYDPEKRITGQLHGGTASCTSITYDAYGKFAVSWDYGSSPSSRLKEWLDPIETGVEVLDGWDPNNAGIQYDASLIEIIEPNGHYCETDSIHPVVVISNNGAVELVSLVVSYQLNQGDFVDLLWEGLLETGGNDTLYLEPFAAPVGNHQLFVMVSEPNGQPDENPFNNGFLRNFGTNGHSIAIELLTDDQAEELAWMLINDDGEVLYQYDSLSNNTLYNWPLCMAPGCYTFVIENSSGGLSDPGYYSITNNSLFQSIAFGNAFDGVDSISFCLSFPAASFTAAQDTICNGSELQFYNHSMGAESFFWEFEGGEPAASIEEHPLVYYAEPGTYDVSLTIVNGTDTVSFMQENFVIVEVCTGLERIETSHVVRVQPNPANGQFRVTISNVSQQSLRLSVLNAFSQEVYKQEFKGSGSEIEIPVDISHLPGGIYLLLIESTAGKTVKKIVKH
jgi:lysyl endopeptidase